jgi:hypothetical protein
MTYRELGRTPIDILCIKLRIVNFWNRLISNKKKLSCILYKIMFNLSIIDNVQYKWLKIIKSIFEEPTTTSSFSATKMYCILNLVNKKGLPVWKLAYSFSVLYILFSLKTHINI